MSQRKIAVDVFKIFKKNILFNKTKTIVTINKLA